jgi:hypothetical protein
MIKKEIFILNKLFHIYIQIKEGKIEGGPNVGINDCSR